MKKACIMLLLICFILVNLIPFSSSAAAEVYLNEIFDDYATNSPPGGAIISGGYDSRVIEDEKQKKLLLHCGEDDFVGAKFLFKAKSKMFVEFEIKLSEVEGGNISLRDSLGRIYNILSIKPTGAVCTSDGREISANAVASAVRIGTYVNTRTKRYDVFVQGRKTISNYYAATMKLKDIASVELGFLSPKDKEGDYLVSFVKAYNAVRPDTTPYKSYNSRVLDFQSSSGKEEKQNIYVNVDFESGSGTFSQILTKDNANTMEVKSDPITGNGYLEVISVLQDTLMDHNISINDSRFIVEADFYINKVEGKCSIFSGAHANLSGVDEFLILSQGNVLKTYDNEVITKIKKEKWSRISMAVNVNRKTFDVYVDGELKLEAYPFRSQAGERLKFIRLQFRPGADETHLLVDNFRIYSGKTLLIDSLDEEEQRG
jgi:hypothetical protein